MAGRVGADAQEQTLLIRSLTNPALYGAGCTDVRVIETHISYVLLTGNYAYKIKKAVDLEFLDFTTLAARHFYCDREVGLNRRLAPAIYLGVVAITGTIDIPRIGGDGPVLEYAVKMLEFPQDALLTRVLERGALTPAHVDTLAAIVATFHGSAPKAVAGSRFGSSNEIRDLAIENFTEIEPLLEHDADRRVADNLRRWTEREHAARATIFSERQRSGFVRECHGDLHLGNIVLVDGSPTIFDCIEFNEDMRWSDVMADVAFLVMDLRDRRRPDLASRFLSGYLELTGDYDGVQVLRFYVVYRAMVRAKVACMRARQVHDAAAHAAIVAEYREYLKLATCCAQSSTSGIVITRGPAGSGKTSRSAALVEYAGAIRIRTDVERKRIHGLPPLGRTESALNAGLYSAAATDRTYAHLARLARSVVRAGYPVVVDGAFLQRRQRDRLRALAADLDVPFAIVDFVASVETLRARVRERQAAGTDASDADLQVLERQRHSLEPIAPDERTVTVTYDAEAPLAESLHIEPWQPVLDRLRIKDSRELPDRRTPCLFAVQSP
jgi:aminoglycoside phosphotransferase family enzyme/predicted kinase